MKRTLTIYCLLTVLASLMLMSSCKEEPSFISDEEILRVHLNLPSQVANYSSPQLPVFFNDQFITIQNNTPTTNPTTNWGATLGRVLFYDKQLSKNNTISCASCHQQGHGFADTAQLSIGFTGGNTHRHSMALTNAVYYSSGRFFWDERAATLEEQVLQENFSINSDNKLPKSSRFSICIFLHCLQKTNISK